MNKGQVCEEIVVLRRWGRGGGGNLSTKMYYIYIIYIYSKSEIRFFHSTVSICRSRARYIWTPKENNMDKFISWCIPSSTSPYSGASKRCNPYLKEKLLITCRHELSSLNKHNKLVSSCRYRIKALLRNN